MKATFLSTVATVALLAGVTIASATSTTTTTVTRETTTGATGGATVVISPEERTTIREYVVKQKRPSVRVQERVVVGATLPQDVELYTIEGPPTVTRYRYSVVNEQPVLVDPGTRRVIQVIE